MMLLARGRSVTELSGVLLRDGGCNQGVSVTCKRKKAFVMPLVHVSAKHFAMESCVLIPRRGHGIVARAGVYRNNLVYHSATGFALGGSADARYNVVFSVRDMGKNYVQKYAWLMERLEADAAALVESGVATDGKEALEKVYNDFWFCLLYTSPSPRDQRGSRMPSSA